MISLIDEIISAKRLDPFEDWTFVSFRKQEIDIFVYVNCLH